MNVVKAILIVLILTVGLKSMAQDVIIKNDKKEINSKVIEITEDVIKYRKFEMLDGPIYSINKSEVFMIIYKNGTKEYFDSKPKQNIESKSTPTQAVDGNDESRISAFKPAEPVHPIQPIQPIQEPLIDINSKPKDVSMVSLGTTTSLTVWDMEMFEPLGHNFYWGASTYASFSDAGTLGIYPFVAYKLPLSNTGFNIWANAGYNFSYTAGYYIGDTHIAESYSNGFLWEIGADYFFSKSWGVTLYSPTLSGLFFGFIRTW